MIFVVILSWIILILAILFLASPSGKGKLGELIVAMTLKLKLDKEKYTILKNVIIPDNEGGTTQIDHIVLSCYGIFVIETKNMRGNIYGSEHEDNWTQLFSRKNKNSFQNPFRQNYKHIVCLADSTGVSEKNFMHIIAFVGTCQIKTREKLPKSLITGGQEMLNYIYSFTDEIISKDELERIKGVISSIRLANTVHNQKEHVKHVKSIIERKNDKSGNYLVAKQQGLKEKSQAISTENSNATQQNVEAISSVIDEQNSNDVPNCPRCGAKMVKRQGKSGINQGKIFWGCSNYPKCRGIINNDMNNQ